MEIQSPLDISKLSGIWHLQIIKNSNCREKIGPKCFEYSNYRVSKYRGATVTQMQKTRLTLKISLWFIRTATHVHLYHDARSMHQHNTVLKAMHGRYVYITNAVDFSRCLQYRLFAAFMTVLRLTASWFNPHIIQSRIVIQSAYYWS